MSNFCNKYFGENNNNNNNEFDEEQQQRRRFWTQQLTSSQAIEPINRFISPPINNEDNTNIETTETNFEQNLTTQLQELNTNQTIITDNLEQQETTMDATQFNQLIAALGQLTTVWKKKYLNIIKILGHQIFHYMCL